MWIGVTGKVVDHLHWYVYSWYQCYELGKIICMFVDKPLIPFFGFNVIFGLSVIVRHSFGLD